jgi:hypothetical protein
MVPVCVITHTRVPAHIVFIGTCTLTQATYNTLYLPYDDGTSSKKGTRRTLEKKNHHRHTTVPGYPGTRVFASSKKKTQRRVGTTKKKSPWVIHALTAVKLSKHTDLPWMREPFGFVWGATGSGQVALL